MGNEVIGNGLFALAAALLAISFSYWQYRRQLRISHDDEISNAKKKIIENLFSYRFVLIGARKNDPIPTEKFNAALSAIPIHFSHSKRCIDLYKGIGNEFTPEKYYELVIALMEDVPLSVENINKDLLENVPNVTPKTG